MSATLTDASLSEQERNAIDLLVAALRERLGGELRAVWLFGSRARGESAGADSDVDLLVVTEGGRRHDLGRVSELAWEAATAAGTDPAYLSTLVMSPERLRNRREIESFFMQEVDRDKIVLHGEP